MSVQPQWITTAGSLGTIPEGVFYSVPIEATAANETVYYQLIAGQLPAGIQISSNGTITGVPRSVIKVQGVPTPVSYDVVSKFAVRAYTTKVVNGLIIVDRLADRTFSLTVTGQDAPEFTTNPGNVGTFYDGTAVEIQIQYTDVDPGDRVRVRLISGELPPGLYITEKGLISGVIEPLVGPPGTAPAGFSSTYFDQYPFDFSTRSTSTNYQFTLEVSDGKESNIGIFEIYVYSKDSMSADTTDFTADNTFITADVVPTRTPVLLNHAGSIGRARSDNFYAYKFEAVDFDGDPEEYIIVGPPPGLTLNPVTGWLYGYIPSAGATEITYDFTVKVRKLNQPTIESDPVSYNLTIVGDVETAVIWTTDSDLGTIDNGAVSTLYVEAISTAGRKLSYQLLSGSNSRLPQGLTLQPSGALTGTVSFNTFALDGGTTVFDKDSKNRGVTQETTFDTEFTFTVNAYAPGSDSELISVFRIFTVRVIRAFNDPYQGLYIKCMPPNNDRALIAQLVQNQDIIPEELVYRLGDPNFGVSSSVIYNHAFGLTPANIDEYVAALDINHYWKNLTLGEIKYAQARNSAGDVIYEAVYSLVVDNLVNNEGQSVSKQVSTAYPVVRSVPWTWNPDEKGTGIVLSNDKLTATGIINNSDNAVVLGAYAIEPGAKAMFSLTQTVWAPANDSTGIGIANANVALNQWIGQDNNSGGFYDDGIYWSNSDSHAGYSVFNFSPAIIDIAVDRLNNLIWIRVNGGNWNNSSSASPTNAIGGRDISNITGTVYPCYSPMNYNGVPGQATVNSQATYTVPYGFTFAADTTTTSIVYPNSLINMRTQVIDTVGQVNPMLPAWMTSKQENGRVLGFVPAWVIAYVKPGQGGRIVYNIQQQFGDQLNTIDFKADRYEIDRRATFAWNNEDQQWISQPPAATTFDLSATPVSWRNELLQVIQWINDLDNILLWKSDNESLTGATIFDGGSTTFITPAPTVTTTDQYDKYLLYPRVNILG